MKIPSLILAILTQAFCVIAQIPNLDWVATAGGSTFDNGADIAIDLNGNVFTTGSFKKTVDFDPGNGVFDLSAWDVNYYDAFIQKLDEDGNFIWATSFGNGDDDRGTAVCVDDAGNLYALGYYEDSIEVDPGIGEYWLYALGMVNTYLIKYDPNGNLLWANTIGGSGHVWGEDMVIDGLGNLYLTGHFGGTPDFDPGPGISNISVVGGYDLFVQKIDSNGNMLWIRTIGGNIDQQGFALCLDDYDNIYVTGTFEGTADFDPGIGVYNVTTTGQFDVFVLKLDLNGNFDWVANVGGTQEDQGYGINTDQNGNVYATGRFEGLNADFDPGSGTSLLDAEGGSIDIFLFKLDSTSNFQWAVSFGSIYNDSGRDVLLDAQNNVTLSGSFTQIIDFDPGVGIQNVSAFGGTDIFILTLDQNGNYIWAGNIGSGGSGGDYPSDLEFDQLGNFYLTGSFSFTSDLDFDTSSVNVISNGSYDIFTAKYLLCDNNYGIDQITACQSYTWIDGITYTSDNNVATYILTNSSGCDSIISLDLTINSVDTSITFLNPSMFVNSSGMSYQWLDCNNNYSIIPGETSQAFTPTINGNYAAIVTENGCSDTSECYVVSSITGTDIEKINMNLGMTIFPNPTSESFSVMVGGQIITKIELADISGRLVYKEIIGSNTWHSNQLKLPSGSYIVKVIVDEKIYSNVLLIQ